MLTTSWSQWRHFNAHYPQDPLPGLGYEGRAPVGCMPVSGAQLARFHSWPIYGHSSYTDHDANSANLIAGSFAADFNAPIDWQSMQATYDPWQDEPQAAVTSVADLMYRLGVVVNIDFGSFSAGGSSASLQALNRGMNRAFYFERGFYLARSGDESAFDAALRADILAGLPVVCAIPGHAVIVDGLSTTNGIDYYHVNYGLAGLNDGWYPVDGIPDGALQSAIFRQRPMLAPLLHEAGFVTNVTGHLALNWSVADARAGEVDGIRVREGHLVAGDFVDYANGLGRWTDYAAAWELESPGYGGGSCFRKTGEFGDFPLATRDVFIPTPDTRVQYNYKAILADDHVYLEVSQDRGKTWQVLRHLTNTGWDTNWYADAVDLAAYAGAELMLRVRYLFDGGSYFAGNGGAWLDNVSINDIQEMQWTTLEDSLDPDARTFDAGVTLSGTRHFEVQVSGAGGWSQATPFTTVTVELDPQLDVDADGLANGWEDAYFGSPTGGVAQADGDDDGADNLAEQAAGTDPTDAGSCFAIVASTIDASGAPIVTWSSVSGRTYAVLRAGSVSGAFVPVATAVVATPPLNTYLDGGVTGAVQAVYRIQLE